MRALFENNQLQLITKRIDEIKAYEPMFHSHIEILYVLSGKAEIIIDGEKKELHRDDCCIIFPYSVHSYMSSPDTKAMLLMFNQELVPDFSDTLFFNKPECPFFEANEIYNLIECIFKYSKNDDLLAKITLKGYICALMGEILIGIKLVKVDNLERTSVQKILIYCSNNYKQNISIKSISVELFISQRQITNIFASKLHCSFRSYINLLRVNEATNLLKNTDMKIIDIMYECGFKNQSSFNRIFYDIMSVTPSEYRSKLMSDNTR